MKKTIDIQVEKDPLLEELKSSIKYFEEHIKELTARNKEYYDSGHIVLVTSVNNEMNLAIHKYTAVTDLAFQINQAYQAGKIHSIPSIAMDLINFYLDKKDPQTAQYLLKLLMKHMKM